MQDSKYCYPDSNVLKNLLNIQDETTLLEAEIELTSIRLMELQINPIKGEFDFNHLKQIHHYIFQDLFEWAGMVRTVEIGKGNLFCTTKFIEQYANTVFSKYFNSCYKAKDNIRMFVKVLAENHADLNALHPFREGNGRAQREFARQVCLKCGYYFDLSSTTHEEMLKASIVSFNTGDTSLLESIFSKAVIPITNTLFDKSKYLRILTKDDLIVNLFEAPSYTYYDYSNREEIEVYHERYVEKIEEMKKSK